MLDNLFSVKHRVSNSVFYMNFFEDTWHRAGNCFTSGLTSKLTHLGHIDSTGGYVKYDFYFWKTLDHVKMYSSCYYCPFTRKEIEVHLNEIRSSIGIDCNWDIRESEDLFCISLRIHSKYKTRLHFYVLTRLRYLYEFPYCAYLRDAFRLREYYPEKSLDELYFRVVESINCRGIYFYDAYHSVPGPLESFERYLFDPDQYYDSARNLTIQHLNDLVRRYIPENALYYRAMFPEENTLYHPSTSYLYWFSEEGFKLRKPIYDFNILTGDVDTSIEIERIDMSKFKAEVIQYSESIKEIPEEIVRDPDTCNSYSLLVYCRNFDDYRYKFSDYMERNKIPDQL